MISHGIAEIRTGNDPLRKLQVIGGSALEIETDAVCSLDIATGLLKRPEAPLSTLRLRRLLVAPGVRGAGDDASVSAFILALETHPSLRELRIKQAPLGSPAVFDKLCAAACCLTQLSLAWGSFRTPRTGHLTPACAHGLAFLLKNGRLTSLSVKNRHQPLFDAAGAVAFADALRTNHTLLNLELANVSLWQPFSAGIAIVAALVGHSSVEQVDFHSNSVLETDRLAVGDALRLLVAANSPSLLKIGLIRCDLGNDGLRGAFQALAGNTRLSSLSCHWNKLAAPFDIEVLHAVRGNTSLRELGMNEETADRGRCTIFDEEVALVKARSAGAAASA